MASFFALALVCGFVYVAITQPWWVSLCLLIGMVGAYEKLAKGVIKPDEAPNLDMQRFGVAPTPAPSAQSGDKPSAFFHWPGGGYEFGIAGTSFYQPALKKIAGDHGAQIARVNTVAQLVPDPDNPYDNKAVRIDIRGMTVGHLSREDARSFRRRLGAKKMGMVTTTCDAEVWGGNSDRHGKEWGYGVKLDIKPFGW